MEALYNQRPGYTLLSNFQTFVTENSVDAFANSMAADFASSTDAALAATVTTNLGLTGDAQAAGNAYLEGQFASNPAARGKVILDAMNILATMESDPVFGAVATTFNADIIASLSYSANASNTEVTTSDAAADVVAGSTLTLTTAVDTAITGDAGNDTINGMVNYSGGALTTTTTYNAGDQIKGAGGTDTFNITISGANVAGDTLTPTMIGIETVAVSNYETEAGTSLTVDLSLADSDLATVGTTASTNVNADTLFTNITKSVALTMAGKGDLTVSYDAATMTGAADAATVTLNDVGTSATTLSTLQIASIETLTVNSATAANFVALSNTGAVTAVNVEGDQNINLDILEVSVTAIDASTASGVVTVDADAIALSALTSVKGGTGTADVLQIDEAVSVTGATAATNTLSKVSGFETVKVDGAAVAVALTTNDSGITSWNFDDAATQQTLTLNTGYDQAVTVKLGDTDDVTNSANIDLTVNIDSDDLLATNAIAGGTGTSDIINVTAKAGTSVLTNVTLMETINILAGAAGTEDVTMNVGAADGTVASGKTLTVDASALTNSTAVLSFTGTGETNGSFVVTGGAGADTLIGGAGADTLTGNGGIDTLTGAAGNDTIDGGAGNDIIDGGAGNDTVTAGDGDDAITAGTGVDNLSGGAGNDTFTLAGNLTADDVIDGGDGTDTLSVTSVVSTALTGVTNVENLAVTGAASVSLSADLSFSTIDLQTGASAEAVTFATGYTQATTVKVDDGDDVTNTAADIDLTVSADSDALAAADNTVLTGSDKAGVTNTLNVRNTAGTIDMQTDISDFDVVNISDHLTTAGNDLSVDVTSYGVAADTLTINAGDLDSGEQLTIVGASTADLTVVAGAGIDTLVFGAGNDTLTAGAGNDILTAGTNITYQDTVDAGDGTDTMTATALVDIDLQNVTNLEKLTATTSATLGAYAQAAGVTEVTTVTTASVDATAMTAALTIKVAESANNQTLTGGQGDDTFVFNATGTLVAADVLNGTSGNDTIRIDNDDADADTTGDNTAVTIDAISNIDTVTVNDTATDDSAGDVTITMANGTYDQTTLTVDGSALDAGEVLTFTANAITQTDEAFIVTGGGDADSLTGGAGNDTLSGGAGADTLSGGGRADTLTGGSGSDFFSFAEADSIGANTDTITDFVASADNLVITVVADTATGAISVTDSGDAASAAAGLTLLSSKQGEYFFNTGTGQFMMDTDGNGLIQASDFVLTLTGETGFSSADINAVVTSTSQDGAKVITTGAGDDYIQFDDSGDNDVDTVTGGSGNDTYVASDSGEADIIVEAASGGTDTLFYNNATFSALTMTVGTTVGGAAADSLANIEQLVLLANSTVTLDDDAVDGATLAINASAAGTTTLAIAADAGTNSIDLSNLTFSAINYTGSDGESTAGVAFDASDVITITGNSGVDTITAAATVKNIITGGDGDDAVTGGSGIDEYVFASTAANETGSSAGMTISSFTGGTDILDVKAFETAGALVQLTGSKTITAGVVYFLEGQSSGAADTSGAAITAMNAAATITDTANTAWIMIVDDNSSAIYEWTGNGGGNEATGDTMTLVGTINSVMQDTDLAIT